MEQLTANHWLVILGIIAIIAEVMMGAPTGFDAAIAGVIFVLSGSVGVAVDSLPVALGLVALLSAFYILLGRGFLKNKLTVATRSTNVEALIGKSGMVIKKITGKNPGQVKIEGEIWRAEANSDIDVDALVVVDSVSGVSLRVSPKSGQ